MSMHFYDSPTFLNQKDKYLAGLSLPQLMVAGGVAFFWFLISLALPFSTLIRILVVIPLTGFTLTMLFARISGLSIPMYLALALLRTFKRPRFEETAECVVNGRSDWLETERLRADRPGLFSRVRRRRRVVSQDPDIQGRQAELQAELDKQIVTGSVAVEQWGRDAIRAFFRGR